MSRRASLPGADELFRAKPLVSVPDVVASEDAVKLVSLDLSVFKIALSLRLAIGLSTLLIKSFLLAIFNFILNYRHLYTVKPGSFFLGSEYNFKILSIFSSNFPSLL